MAAANIVVGATCRIGKGKTLWEIVGTRGETTVELSALGRGGFVNKSANVDELTQVEAQRMGYPLNLVLSARAAARTAAGELNDRLRFSDPGSIYRLADRAEEAAYSYGAVCEGHSRELVDLGIREG